MKGGVMGGLVIKTRTSCLVGNKVWLKVEEGKNQEKESVRVAATQEQ